MYMSQLYAEFYTYIWCRASPPLLPCLSALLQDIQNNRKQSTKSPEKERLCEDGYLQSSTIGVGAQWWSQGVQ